MRQFSYYSDIAGTDLAERFLAAVRQTMTSIGDGPNAGSPKYLGNPRLAGLRSWPIAGFDIMRAYYLTGQDRITVLRLLHGRRDIERIFDTDEI
ncbi:type II toxin-antitoxin system RelE/ParE family toxin [Pararhizobium sp.]|uniref:type II toxin-antitoxin system RelE/ParE family toxin n=1 Tax=Pararhizobium sp. TaxID=1977563 RepID=UPI002724D8B4|nr:type II toxin-antitoxin system RelE/ParE family toxin [Pararhizobium sp.]MDO9414816.1 type II toxin-antitoxin system RelE/ParE family toxin [Pararhizobium sp.]